MNLVIDIGNTLCKLALFEGKLLIKSTSIEKLDVGFLQDFFEKEKSIRSTIVSSVVNHSPEINLFLKEKSHFIELNSTTKIPIKNLYQTPETLGKDRLACAVGANHLFPDTNVLAIDAGTCIKYDFVNEKNEYLGGGISLGLEMRLKALHTFTEKLPLIPFQKENELIGTNTQESILSGAINGAVLEVKGVVSEYEQRFKDLKVIITGGNGGFFEKTLKSTIFADPFLVLKGLNVILNSNESKSKGV